MCLCVYMYIVKVNKHTISSSRSSGSSSSRRGRSVSSADRSRAAYRLADLEFHPSSFGHSHLYSVPPVTTTPSARCTEHLKVSSASKLLICWRSTVSAVTRATLPSRPLTNGWDRIPCNIKNTTGMYMASSAYIHCTSQREKENWCSKIRMDSDN